MSDTRTKGINQMTKRMPRLPRQPRYIQMETIIGCDAECTFCPQRSITREPRFMAEDTWRKIIDDTRGLGITYRPFLQNEALLDRRLAEIVSYIKRDATARAEIVGLSYERVVDNINRFIETAAGLNHYAVTEVRMIDMDINKHEQNDFIEYWSKRADRALIVPLYNWPWDKGIEMVPKPCLKMREEMFFYTDGRAVLCCWDIAGRAVIGDVTNERVIDIWNGATRRRYAELLANGKREKITLCSRCDAYRDRHFEGFAD
jgi:hypothetical protein